MATDTKSSKKAPRTPKAPAQPKAMAGFLASDKKLTDLSRQELYDLLTSPSCPEVLQAEVAREFGSRIR
jgi:hypothetical protein